MHLVDTIIAFGYIGVTITIFAESGFLFGFFLPGDSLLVTLGLLASQGELSIGLLLLLCIPAAILGDNLGYATGRTIGQTLYNREDSLFFKKKHLIEAHAFFEKHGPRSIVLARFVPVVRTFTPIVAGMAKMNYRTFMIYNILGGLLWTVGLLGISYLIGVRVPGVERYLGYIIATVIFVSLIPIIKPIVKRVLIRLRKRQTPSV
jgi:membrane-associated protein